MVHSRFRPVTLSIAMTLTLGLLLLGCARPKVQVPPRMDLRGVGTIGLIQVDCETPRPLGRYPTHRLLSSIQASQPGVALLELGSEEEVLAEVGHAQLDFRAVQAIGAYFKVDAVLVGRLELTAPRPKLQLSNGFQSLRAEARVEGMFHTRLLRTDNGATVWSAASRGSRSLAQLRAARKGSFDLDTGDLDDPYTPLIGSLVHEATRELRPTWERR